MYCILFSLSCSLFNCPFYFLFDCDVDEYIHPTEANYTEKEWCEHKKNQINKFFHENKNTFHEGEDGKQDIEVKGVFPAMHSMIDKPSDSVDLRDDSKMEEVYDVFDGEDVEECKPWMSWKTRVSVSNGVDLKDGVSGSISSEKRAERLRRAKLLRGHFRLKVVQQEITKNNDGHAAEEEVSLTHVANHAVVAADVVMKDHSMDSLSVAKGINRPTDRKDVDDGYRSAQHRDEGGPRDRRSSSIHRHSRRSYHDRKRDDRSSSSSKRSIASEFGRGKRRKRRSLDRSRSRDDSRSSNKGRSRDRDRERKSHKQKKSAHHHSGEYRKHGRSHDDQYSPIERQSHRTSDSKRIQIFIGTNIFVFYLFLLNIYIVQ